MLVLNRLILGPPDGCNKLQNQGSFKERLCLSCTPASVKVARGTADDPGFSALTPPRSGPNLAKMCPRSRALICQKMVPNGRNLALILQFVVIYFYRDLLLPSLLLPSRGYTPRPLIRKRFIRNESLEPPRTTRTTPRTTRITSRTIRTLQITSPPWGAVYVFGSDGPGGGSGGPGGGSKSPGCLLRTQAAF